MKLAPFCLVGVCVRAVQLRTNDFYVDTDGISWKQCRLFNGNTLAAGNWMCSYLKKLYNKYKNKKNMVQGLQLSEQGERCPVLELPDGQMICTDGQRGQSICLGRCNKGYKKKKVVMNNSRCVAKMVWQENSGKREKKLQWSTHRIKCEKEKEKDSPCKTANGGCSDYCLSRGDNNAVCSCPCGLVLDTDQKTCIRTNLCPYDFSFWLDGSTTACTETAYHDLQVEKAGMIMSFYGAYVRDDTAKMAAAYWSAGGLSHEFGSFDSDITSVEFLRERVENVPATCGAADLGMVFNHFRDSSDRTIDSTAVHIVFVGDQLDNNSSDLHASRPMGDNTLVMVSDQIDQNSVFRDQVNILGCGETHTCDRVMKLSSLSDDGSDIEAKVNRDGCLDRQFSSILSCSEFHMKLEVPICSFLGLQLAELTFDSTQCSSSPTSNSTHYSWVFSYNDCGTVKETTDSYIKYSNALKSIPITEFEVTPEMPEFNQPLVCQLSLSHEFELDGNFEIKIEPLKTVVRENSTLTGDLDMFTDDMFTVELDMAIENGNTIYAQSGLDLIEAAGIGLQLASCMTAPGPIENMAVVDSGLPTWTFINEGCILDDTLTILPKGEDGEVRFSFESFNFHNNTNPVNVQCSYKACQEGEACPSILTCPQDRRKRASVMNPQNVLDIQRLD